jgi:hypothetical protein
MKGKLYLKIALILLSLALLHVSSAMGQTIPIDSGQTLSGSIDGPSGMGEFQFYGDSGDRVVINAVKTSGTLAPRIYLYSPSGVLETDSGVFNHLSWLLQETGLYTILVMDSILDRTGGYNITLMKIPGAASSLADPDGGAIASGETLSATINVASDMDGFQFHGDSGDRVVINAVKTSGTLAPHIFLYSPSGVLETDSGVFNHLSWLLQETGLYTILVMDSTLDRTGTYNITLIKIPGAASSLADPDGGAIASSQTLNAAINVASDMDGFQFYGNSGDRAVINAVSTSGTLAPHIFLYSPSGVLETDSGVFNHLDWLLLETGLYTIVVMDFNLDSTGTYNVSLAKIPSTVRPGIYNPSPTDKSTINNTDPVLSWDAVSGATGYDVFLGDNSTQPMDQIGINLSDHSLALTNLEYGKVYYWQVVAHTPGGDIGGPVWWFRNGSRLSMVFTGVANQVSYGYWSYEGDSFTADPIQGGGRSSHAPAVAVYRNRQYLAVKGVANNNIYIRSKDCNGNLTGWTQVAGLTSTSPSLMAYNNRLYLFVKGAAATKVYYKSMDATGVWSSWSEVSASGTPFKPALVVFNGRLYLFLTDGQNHISYRHMDSTGSWSDWYTMPTGSTNAAPAVVEYNGSIWLLVKGLNGNALWYRTTATPDTPASWNPWTSLAGSSASSPSAVVEPESNRLHIAVRGSVATTIWHRYFDPNLTSWSPWEPMTAMDPDATSLDTPVLSVF